MARSGMRVALIALALLSNCRARSPPSRGFGQVRAGFQRMCVGGRPHVLKFATAGAADEMFVPIDPALVVAVACDIDSTQIQLQMRDQASMQKFTDIIDQRKAAYGQAFLTGSASNGTFTCANTTEAAAAARAAAAAEEAAAQRADAGKPAAHLYAGMTGEQLAGLNMSDAEKKSVCESMGSTCDQCRQIGADNLQIIPR